MGTCKLYIIRHGQSTHNRDYITSGQVDPPLTKLGTMQATETKERLSDVVFDDVYSSDLARAIQTAEIITGKEVPKLHQLTELRERDFGRFDGKSEKMMDGLADSLREKFNSLPNEEQWRFKYAPDIESDDELSHRIVSMIEKIAQENSGKTILIASHGGAIRTMLIKLQHLNTTSLPRGAISNTGYVEIEYEKRGLRVLRIEGAKVPSLE